MATLFQDTFDGQGGTVDLKVHDPLWEYQGADSRYRVHAAGYADAGITGADFDSIARYDYTVPVGVKRFRVQGPILREDPDAVGGGLALNCYIPATAIGSWDLKDYLQLIVQRANAGEVNTLVIWVKATTEPPPATLLLASATVTHLGNTAHWYTLEVDELALTVRIYRADDEAGTNEILLGSGSLPPELVVHAAADRMVGWYTTRAASGLVNFELYDFKVVELEVPSIGVFCTHLLDVFDDDRETILWSVATDPAHPFPYLDEPENYAEQSIDVAKGAATIGTVRARILDKSPSGDQDGGFMAARLAEGISGRRCRWTRFDELGNPIVMVDGPASLPTMDSSYAAFEFVVEDTREHERKLRAFDDVIPNIDASEDEADLTPTTGGTFSGIAWNTQLH